MGHPTRDAGRRSPLVVGALSTENPDREATPLTREEARRHAVLLEHTDVCIVARSRHSQREPRPGERTCGSAVASWRRDQVRTWDESSSLARECVSSQLITWGVPPSSITRTTGEPLTGRVALCELDAQTARASREGGDVRKEVGSVAVRRRRSGCRHPSRSAGDGDRA